MCSTATKHPTGSAEQVVASVISALSAIYTGTNFSYQLTLINYSAFAFQYETVDRISEALIEDEVVNLIVSGF